MTLCKTKAELFIYLLLNLMATLREQGKISGVSLVNLSVATMSSPEKDCMYRKTSFPISLLCIDVVGQTKNNLEESIIDGLWNIDKIKILSQKTGADPRAPSTNANPKVFHG